MSYSVEVRVNTYEGGLIPHTFLVFNDGTNEFGIGFAPEVTGLTGPGLLHDDYEHRYDASSGQLPLSEAQYNKLLEYVGKTAANPPYYNLPQGEQCTVWAVRGLVEAGVLSPYLAPYPNNGDLTSAVLTQFAGFVQTLLFNPYTQKIGFEINDLWNLAKNWIARYDPLVLDLDGDGIETVGVNATTHILFDHNNDGLKTGTGWVNGDDGLLVLDRNGIGVIDNGSELFGDGTMVKATDGFSALRFRHPELVSGSKKSAMNNLDFENVRGVG